MCRVMSKQRRDRSLHDGALTRPSSSLASHLCAYVPIQSMTEGKVLE